MISRRKFIFTALASSVSFTIDNQLLSNIAFKSLKNELGVCTSLENAALLKKYGYDFIEELVGKFLVPKENDEKFALNLDKLKTSGMPLHSVVSFLPSDLKCVGPDDYTDAILKYSETCFKRLKLASAKYLVFGSGGARRIPNGYDKEKAIEQFIEINKKIAPIAERYGIVVLLEPLNVSETNLLNTVEEGITLVNKINHPNIRLLADIYHMLKDREDAHSLIKAGKLLKHVHIAEKENRTAPGVSGDDFTPYLSALKKIHYKGKISIECRWKDMETELPKAINTLKSQMI